MALADELKSRCVGESPSGAATGGAARASASVSMSGGYVRKGTGAWASASVSICCWFLTASLGSPGQRDCRPCGAVRATGAHFARALASVVLIASRPAPGTGGGCLGARVRAEGAGTRLLAASGAASARRTTLAFCSQRGGRVRRAHAVSDGGSVLRSSLATGTID